MMDWDKLNKKINSENIINNVDSLKSDLLGKDNKRMVKHLKKAHLRASFLKFLFFARKSLIILCIIALVVIPTTLIIKYKFFSSETDPSQDDIVATMESVDDNGPPNDDISQPNESAYSTTPNSKSEKTVATSNEAQPDTKSTNGNIAHSDAESTIGNVANNNENSSENDASISSETTENESDSNDFSLSDWKRENYIQKYKELLERRDSQTENSMFNTKYKYTVYDIDKNDVPELIIMNYDTTPFSSKRAEIYTIFDIEVTYLPYEYETIRGFFFFVIESQEDPSKEFFLAVEPWDNYDNYQVISFDEKKKMSCYESNRYESKDSKHLMLGKYLKTRDVSDDYLLYHPEEAVVSDPSYEEVYGEWYSLKSGN